MYTYKMIPIDSSAYSDGKVTADWHRLDNTGIIYSLIRSDWQTTLFRLTAVLSDPVDPERITNSIKAIMPRFPYFQVVLKPGVFWYYFEKTSGYPPVQEDQHYPCTHYEKRWAVSPVHVYYKADRLSVEYTHALTDGYGGMVFLRALLSYYFGDLSEEGKQWSYSLLKIPAEEEWEDGYSTHYDPSVPSSRQGPKAFHLPYKVVSPGVYYSTTGIVPLKDVLERARADGGSLTEWLTSRYIAVMMEMIQDFHWEPDPLVVNIPVNLRGLFSSRTLRNFFVSLTPHLDSRVGYFQFGEILSHVKNFMALQVDRRFISQQFKRNVNFERNKVIRLVPLFLKRLIFPFFYYHLGERQYSGGFSNLGKFELPPAVADKVKEVHILVPPSPGTRIKAGCLSYGGQLFITFGSLAEEKELERRFFSKLRKEGIPVRIDVNY